MLFLLPCAILELVDNKINQPVTTPEPPPTQSKNNTPLIIGGTALILLLVGGAYYLGANSNKPTTQLPLPTSSPVVTTAPSIAPTQAVVEDPTPQPNSTARKISYSPDSGWLTFSSNTGYSIQYPPAFGDYDGSGELLYEGKCSMHFDNGAGGSLLVTVRPYNGESRRQLYGTPAGYTYKFEEVIIQGKNSLLIETGPIGDSGSGTGAVIPVGNTALIVSWSNRAKNSPDVNKLLQSIKINPSLDISKCQ